jgi:hypothetical protein
VLFSEAGAPSVLRSIQHIGSRSRLAGRISTPTIAVAGMTVSGVG